MHDTDEGIKIGSTVGELIGFILGDHHGYTLGIDEVLIWVLIMDPFMVPMKLILRFCCLMTHLYQIMGLHCTNLVVFPINIKMVCLRGLL